MNKQDDDDLNVSKHAEERTIVKEFPSRIPAFLRAQVFFPPHAKAPGRQMF